MRDRCFLLAVLACTVIACRPEPAPTEHPTPTEDPKPVIDPVETPTSSIAAPWTVVVADGSANIYRCEHPTGGAPRFEYIPVTPETSSTGQYSGGPPRSGPMTAAQVDALWQQVDAAIANTTAHVVDRAKGTVAIEASGPSTAKIIVTGTAGADLMAVLAALPDAPAP